MTFAALAVGMLVSAAASVTAQQAGQRSAPTGPVDSCTTSGCHDRVLEHDHLHGPLNVEACGVCHLPADESTHRFEFAAQGMALCTGCHEQRLEPDIRTGSLAIHAPGFDGACIDCHDPHGGQDRALLKQAGPGDLCRACHDTVEAAAPARHHADGNCLACHSGHPGGHASLLRADGADLCNRCHDNDLGLDAPGTAQVHGPVAVACLPCHEPHGTTHGALLRQAPAPLCLGCHADTIGDPDTMGHAHATADASACLSCHEAHRSDHAFLLQAQEVDLCLRCHADPLKRRDGSVVAGMAAVARSGAHPHAAMDAGCSSCHDAHTDIGALLLMGGYPKAMYAAFDTEAYGLCFGCHDAAAFVQPAAAGVPATGFRDGSRNLHFAHVGAQGNRGRSCRFCHSAHAADSVKLMREEVPFGDWAIPIRFQPTATGGSCAAGCHAARDYDRGE